MYDQETATYLLLFTALLPFATPQTSTQTPEVPKHDDVSPNIAGDPKMVDRPQRSLNRLPLKMDRPHRPQNGLPQKLVGASRQPDGPLPQKTGPHEKNVPPQKPVRWTDLNDRPAIGILTQASRIHIEHYGNDYVRKQYINYIESGGAYVVLVQAGQPRKYYQDIFQKINGLLLPGGAASTKNSTFLKATQVFLDLAMEANDNGDHFPIWGTCLGFQTMAVEASSGRYVLNRTDSVNISLPLTLSSCYRRTQMLGNSPQEILDYLTNENITVHSHQFSLLTEVYNQVESLNEFYRIVSTSRGRDGIDFVSTIEARNYPFFAVAWHPEKPAFLRSPDLDIPTNEHAIKIGHYFANFFINEARKSKHRFSSEAERKLWVLTDNPHCVRKKMKRHTDVCGVFSCCKTGSFLCTDLYLGAVTLLCIVLIAPYVWPILCRIRFPSTKKRRLLYSNPRNIFFI